MLETAFAAGIVGCALLLAPVFVDSPLLSPLARALRPLGWMALMICAVFGVAGLLLRRPGGSATRREQDSNPGFDAAPFAVAQRPTHGGKQGGRNSARREPAFGAGDGGNGPAATAADSGSAPPTKPHAQRGTPGGASSLASVPQRLDSWSPAVFAAIEWRRFEAVCEALFAQAGFRTQSQSHGADGGVDVWMYSAHAEGPVAVAQCKHWRNRSVGVKELREFFGVMASHGLKRGTFVTTSIFTSEAMNFATYNGINALDGSRLLRLIASRTPAQQSALLDVAYAGEYWRPTCAICGIKMVERHPASGKPPFWGCANYPRCSQRMVGAAA